MKNEKLKPQKATLDSLRVPKAPPPPDSLLGVMTYVGQERDHYRKALEHIANTSNSYESKYAAKILQQFSQL